MRRGLERNSRSELGLITLCEVYVGVELQIKVIASMLPCEGIYSVSMQVLISEHAYLTVVGTAGCRSSGRLSCTLHTARCSTHYQVQDLVVTVLRATTVEMAGALHEECIYTTWYFSYLRKKRGFVLAGFWFPVMNKHAAAWFRSTSACPPPLQTRIALVVRGSGAFAQISGEHSAVSG